MVIQVFNTKHTNFESSFDLEIQFVFLTRLLLPGCYQSQLRYSCKHQAFAAVRLRSIRCSPISIASKGAAGILVTTSEPDSGHFCAGFKTFITQTQLMI
jgi:hypothetical protein